MKRKQHFLWQSHFVGFNQIESHANKSACSGNMQRKLYSKDNKLQKREKGKPPKVPKTEPNKINRKVKTKGNCIYDYVVN